MQITYSVLFPFERWLVPLAPVAAVAGQGTPIVLVPGFACNRGYWLFFVRALRSIGCDGSVTCEPMAKAIAALPSQDENSLLELVSTALKKTLLSEKS